MRKILIAALCCALPLAATGQDAVESCAACHRDALSLEAWDVAELATRIREMRDGSAPHVVSIPALTDHEIAALAEALAGP